MSNTVKIGIVDDHQLFLDGIERAIQTNEKIKVGFTAISAKIALEKLAKEPVDLIITDISMPEINGIELIQKLNELYPNIKILVLSTHKDMLPHDSIDGYLTKDVHYSKLIDVILKIVVDNKKSFEKQSEEPLTFEFNKTILSKREKEIVKFVSEGFSSEEIANQLFLSVFTVETHKKNIFQKLQVNNTASMVKKATYLGVI